jgi:hypothetical protein
MLLASPVKTIPSSRPCHRFPRDSKETFFTVRLFVTAMEIETESVSALKMGSMDRQHIRVDVQSTQAGIAAALRRAFSAAAVDHSDPDFSDLLRRLN